MKKYLWCLHCEKTYEKTSENDLYECQYSGCDGHYGDIWEWDSFRELNKSYPKTPKHNHVYPMYETK